MSDRWIDHVDIPWHWWPPVEKGDSIKHLVEVFRYFGFEECGMDDKVDDIYDKVAIYDISDEWTHAARVVTDGIMNHIVSYKGKTYLAEHGQEITFDKGKIIIV